MNPSSRRAGTLMTAILTVLALAITVPSEMGNNAFKTGVKTTIETANKTADIILVSALVQH